MRGEFLKACATAAPNPTPIRFATRVLAPQVTLSAAQARLAGRNLVFPADAENADWLTLCEVAQDPATQDPATPDSAGVVAHFRFAARLPGDVDHEAFVRAGYALLFARPADPQGLRYYSDELAGGRIDRMDFLSRLLGSSEAAARGRRFALLPETAALRAALPEGLDELSPPLFLIEA